MYGNSAEFHFLWCVKKRSFGLISSSFFLTFLQEAFFFFPAVVVFCYDSLYRAHEESVLRSMFPAILTLRKPQP